MGFAQQINQRLSQGEYDLVFASGCTPPISRLKCRLPIVIWHDTTWACWISHYGLERGLCQETIRAGHRTERSAYRRCSTIIFSSEWAASSAVVDYGVDPQKVKVVPFGANFLQVPTREDVLQSIAARSMETCRLITIGNGVDWYRKGVPRAIELASTLNNQGTRTELIVVGPAAPSGINLPDFVRVTGFIDKRTRAGERRISQLLGRSHFHVLLSLADATPVVFSEANAHGVPNIASDVGGIGTVVVDDHGGRRFSPAAPIETVAEYIQTYMFSRDRYFTLCMNARRQYDDRLNWNTAGILVRRYLEDAASKQTQNSMSLV
jgi:glycosyltransferase involved in cell wall biosynthesis